MYAFTFCMDCYFIQHFENLRKTETGNLILLRFENYEHQFF